MSIENIFQAILDFDQTKTADLVKSEVAAGSDIKTILNVGLISAMKEVGERFSKGIFFVPEMLGAVSPIIGALIIEGFGILSIFPFAFILFLLSSVTILLIKD